MNYISSFFSQEEQSPSVAHLIADSAVGIWHNSARLLVSGGAGLGTQMIASALATKYLKPEPDSIRDYAVNFFTTLSTAILAAEVVSDIGHAAVPLSPLEVEHPEWFNLTAAALGAGLGALSYYAESQKAAQKKGKKS